MQHTMQNDAAVFRTGETLQEGVREDPRGLCRSFADVKVSDRSLVWNSDLIETLELQNLLGQAVATHGLGGEPQGIARRPCPRGFPGPRRREWHEAHPVLGGRRRAGTQIDYRPVHLTR